MIYFDILTTEYGDIAIIANQHGLQQVAFQQGKAPAQIKPGYKPIDNQAPVHLHNAKQQLIEYFSGQRTSFDLPIAQQGTPFQQKVWQQLTTIPCGKTISYLELAQQIDNPKAIRAVGTANGANKVAIIVPCHRVIGKDQTLTGYAGGIGLKAKLLMLEGAYFKPSIG
ncbi:methylated-DNA--[protein]-cysteine S-methyltransferase [Thalassotalea aquiviva]|uniref:methylated-DNA--[protein]-cysteine S-methyltransferase n=1 Tax=Thalassotalea aquiviva TaxID=3242415 RepID=UPI00352B4DDB